MPHRPKSVGLDLMNLWRLVKRGHKHIAAFGLLGAVAGAIFLALVPHYYETFAQIPLAKAAQLKNLDEATYVSEPRIIVSWVAAPDFMDTETLSQCRLIAEPGNEKLVEGLIRASPL